MKMPTPVFMADIGRAMSTPPPGAQSALAQQPAPQQSVNSRQADEAREAKNERDRLRRKEKRAADLKAAAALAVKPRRKKDKAKKAVSAKTRKARAQANAMALAPKKRGRGRPPGSKNKRPGRPPGAKNRATIATEMVVAAVKSHDTLLAIQQAVTLLNAMPEHARKVVLDAVK